MEESSETFFNFKKNLKKLGKDLSKALLSKGLLDFSQVINLDELYLYLGFPKYKNGIAFMSNIQGLTKVVSIFINYNFLFIILEKSNIYIKFDFIILRKTI